MTVIAIKDPDDVSFMQIADFKVIYRNERQKITDVRFICMLVTINVTFVHFNTRNDAIQDATNRCISADTYAWISSLTFESEDPNATARMANRAIRRANIFFLSFFFENDTF